jgi:hypothetical protein
MEEDINMKKNNRRLHNLEIKEPLSYDDEPKFIVKTEFANEFLRKGFVKFKASGMAILKGWSIQAIDLKGNTEVVRVNNLKGCLNTCKEHSRNHHEISLKKDEDNYSYILTSVEGEKAEINRVYVTLASKPTFVIQESDRQFILVWKLVDNSKTVYDKLAKELDEYLFFLNAKTVQCFQLPGFMNLTTWKMAKLLSVKSRRPLTASEIEEALSFPIWPSPKPLIKTNKAVLPVSKEMMPKLLYQFCQSAALSSGCAIDYVVVPMLAVIGSFIGHKVHLQPTGNTRYLIAANQYGLSIGSPGTGKTPGFNVALNLLEQLIEKRDTEHQELHANREASEEMLGIRLNVLKQNYSSQIRVAIESEDYDLINEIECEYKKERSLLTRKEQQLKGEIKRYKTTNPTFKGLHSLIYNNPNGLLLAMDEINGLFKIIGRKGQEEYRAYLLECFMGFGSYDMDRMTVKSESAKNLVLSIVGNIQPDVLAPYVNSAIKASNENDGWLNRFLLMVYPDSNSKTETTAQIHNEELHTSMLSLLIAIDDSNFGFANSSKVTERNVRLSTLAEDKFSAWKNSAKDSYSSAEMPGVLSSHFNKYDKLVGGLSLIFEIISVYSNNSKQPLKVKEVKSKSVKQAIAFADYLASHAKKVFDHDANIVEKNAEVILKNLHKLNRRFTTRGVYQYEWEGLPRDKSIRESLDYLAQHYFIKHDDKSVRGDWWIKNPLWKDAT